MVYRMADYIMVDSLQITFGYAVAFDLYNN